MSPLSSFNLGDKWSQSERDGDSRRAEHVPTLVLLNTLLRNNVKMVLVEYTKMHIIQSVLINNNIYSLKLWR